MTQRVLHGEPHVGGLQLALWQQCVAARESVGEFLNRLRMIQRCGAKVPAHGFARIDVDAFAARIGVAELVHRVGDATFGCEAKVLFCRHKINGFAVAILLNQSEVIRGLRLAL